MPDQNPAIQPKPPGEGAGPLSHLHSGYPEVSGMMNRIRGLQQAANATSEALIGLDTSKTPCVCCGLNRYTNFQEYVLATRIRQAHNNLNAIIDMAEKSIGLAPPSSP